MRAPCLPLLLALSASVGLAAPFMVEATLPAGIGPNASAVALDGSMLVVANGDSGDLSLLPLAGQPARPPVPVGQVPLALALSADTRMAYVACFSGLTVDFVDLVTGTRTRSIEVGVHPYDLVRIGGKLLVSGYYEGEVVSIDLASGAIYARLKLESGLHRILAHPDGQRAFVLNTGRDVLYELQAAPLRLTRKLDDELGGLGAWDMVMTQDGARICISQWVGNRLLVVETNSMTLHGAVETGGEGACALDVSKDGRWVVVAHSESDDAAVVDIERLILRGRVPVGRFPFSAVRVTADGRHALVTADNAGGLAILDLAQVTNLGLVKTGRIPHVITAGPGGRFYVSNTEGASISVLRPTGRREALFESLYATE